MYYVTKYGKNSNFSSKSNNDFSNIHDLCMKKWSNNNIIHVNSIKLLPTHIRVIFHSQKPSVLINDLNFQNRFQYKTFFQVKTFYKSVFTINNNILAKIKIVNQKKLFGSLKNGFLKSNGLNVEILNMASNGNVCRFSNKAVILLLLVCWQLKIKCA